MEQVVVVEQEIKRLAKEQKIARLKKVGLSAAGLLAVFLIVLLVARFLFPPPPKTWVISQGLANALVKQKTLRSLIKDGGITVGDLARIATFSGVPRAEVVATRDGYLISTGSNGQAFVDLTWGSYKVSVVPVPGIDFTGVPASILVNSPVEIVELGLREGSGQIKGINSILDSFTTAVSKSWQGSQSSKLVIKLYRDTNGNGKRETSESDVLWSGVTVHLQK